MQNKNIIDCECILKAVGRGLLKINQFISFSRKYVHEDICQTVPASSVSELHTQTTTYPHLLFYTNVQTSQAYQL
jgi:hypothetical protein